MNATKKELMKICPATSKHKEAVKKAALYLDEDIQAIRNMQKHIKVVDCYKHGWVMVGVYEDNR